MKLSTLLHVCRHCFIALLAWLYFSVSAVADIILPVPQVTDRQWLPPTPLVILGQHPHVIYNHSHLPLPTITRAVPKRLSLTDAILLALRNNPDVISSQLTRVTDKYALILARNVFQPQYMLSGDATFISKQRPSYNTDASVSVFTPIGTQYSVDYNTDFTEPGSATFSVTQHLLQGFGYVNRIPLENAYDNEKVAKLNFKNSIITVVVTVITNYRSLVADYNNLEIQRENLKQTEETTKQYRLQVKAGKMAPSDLRQQEANLANAKLSYLDQVNQLATNYQQFLTSLGLDPMVRLKIDRKLDFKDEKLPNKKRAITIALLNNIQYQSSVIQMNVTKRAIFVAQSARHPVLDVTFSQLIPDISKPTLNPRNRILSFNWSIPIDDVQTKADLIDAKIAYEKAKLDLEQQKENLIRTVIEDLRELKISRQQITNAEELVKLQRQTLDDSRIKLKYGKITIFEVIQNQNQLLSSETSLISDKISYLNQITTFYQTLGLTLNRWDIKLRY